MVGNNEDGEDGATKDCLLMMMATIIKMNMRMIVMAMMMLKRLASSRDIHHIFTLNHDKFPAEGEYNEDDGGEYDDDGGDDVDIADDVAQ